MQTTDELASLGRIAIAIKAYYKQVVDYPDLPHTGAMSIYLQQQLTAQDWIHLQHLLVEKNNNG